MFKLKDTKIFAVFLFHNQTYVVGTQKNSLNEHPKHMV